MKILYRYLGKDGSPWAIGIPARDLTEADMKEFRLTEEKVLAVVQPDGKPLYEKVEKRKKQEVLDG